MFLVGRHRACVAQVRVSVLLLCWRVQAASVLDVCCRCAVSVGSVLRSGASVGVRFAARVTTYPVAQCMVQFGDVLAQRSVVDFLEILYYTKVWQSFKMSVYMVRLPVMEWVLPWWPHCMTCVVTPLSGECSGWLVQL